MQKVILITGASRGIGAATAKLAGERGYAVAVNYHSNRTAADKVVKHIEQAGGRALALPADIAVESEVVKMFETIDRELGALHALVNNAGILEQQSRLVEMDAARWQRVLATNVTGAFVCAREAVKRMSLKSVMKPGGKGGAIVNVSSAAARIGGAFEYIDYAASKGALDAMTLGLAKEVAMEGIRVNSVRPGVIYTDIHAAGGEPNRVERVKTKVPMQRGGQALEVAQAILWLLSEEASYVTGTIMDVSGGR